MFKVGDIIKVKEGVSDPDFEELNISNWQGKIISIEEPIDNKNYYSIEWDNTTLNQMPEEALRMAWLEGLDATVMVLTECDFEIAEERPHEPRLERDFDKTSNIETRISEIIGDEDIDITETKLRKYRDYLMENLDFSTVVTGIEDFPWEEKYIFGYGDKYEYKKLKKTKPSYRDLYKIIKFEEEIDDMYGILAKVKRLSDRKFFSLPLADLEAKDNKSKSYQILDDYSVWFVNWR